MQDIVTIVVAFDNNNCYPAGVDLFSKQAKPQREGRREGK
ncbi:hypothetical protein JP0016_00160 [Helicobacter pylori]